MTVQEMYEQSIKSLPAGERLRLAQLILNDIPPLAVVDYRDDWSEEDQAEFSRMTWVRIHTALEGEDNG
jgi:hypothetical protein